MKKNPMICRIVIFFLYAILFIPYIYSIYYSMPATDDYAWAIEWFSPNRLIEVVKRVQWNYMNWFGQSGVFAVVIQILFNPLYWFKDEGHSFGICMVIVYALIVVGLICAIKGLAKSLLKIENDLVRSIFTFLLITLLFTTYYYNDVYNWWSGTPGYSMMMVVMLFAMKYISDYVNEHDKKSYIKMIITGAIACTGLMNCVAIGLFYILEVFFTDGFKERIKKDIIPLLIYILSGIITVVAPGNYKRTMSYDKGNVQYIGSIGVTVYRIVKRAVETLLMYPWTIALFLLIVILSVNYNGKGKTVNIKRIIVSVVLTITAAVGAMYPYVAGERKHIEDGFAERAFFVTDFMLFIGFAFIAYEIGQYIKTKSGKKLDNKTAIIAGLLVVVICLGVAKLEGTLSSVIPYDIIQHRGEIAEIYYTWEDVISEIENSDEDVVVIKKEHVPWTKFSYPAGIDPGEYTRINVDTHYYGNTNQCAQIWYGKEEIRVFIN